MMSLRTALVLIAALALAACGDDASVNNAESAIDADAGVDGGVEEIPVTKNCEGPFESTVIEGRFWLDVEEYAVSNYEQPREESSAGVEDEQVSLLLPDGERRETLSCGDGVWRFPGVDASVALIGLPSSRCTSANCPTNFVRQATSAQRVKVVTFGDSIPHYGPEPWFPSRFVELAAPVADVENTNVAVPGSTSEEWLPDSRFFKNRVEAHLDADVWVFSLGGNDLQQFVDQATAAADPASILAELTPLIDSIVANIRATVQKVRELSPEADIVWVIYPNYGTTTYWKSLAGEENAVLVETVLGNLLGDVRRRLTGESGLQIVDILGATEEVDLDSLLIDPLHLNEEGHIFYARELFVTLGGVIMDEKPQGLTRKIGYSDE